MSIGKTLVTVILAAHLLSCFWFWVHCYDALQEVMILKLSAHRQLQPRALSSWGGE